MVITLIILALSAFFFVNGKIRSDVVALCALVLLILCGILTPEEALSGFSNSIVIMMVGLFVVGGAIFQTGLAKMISSKILQLAGKSELKLFILIMLVTSAIGAFVSNTGTVALMLPIVVSMAVSANVSPSRFLMPLAFASSMGGMATLIGTPPNLVIQNALLEGGFEGLSFFSFTPVGIICVLIGIVVLIPLSRMFLVKKGEKKTENKSRKKSLKDLAYEYQIAQNLFRVGVKSDSTFRGKTLAELNITGEYNVTILEIRRESKSQNPFMKTIDQELAGPNTSLQIGDVLYVLGAFAQIELLTKDNNLDLLDTHTAEVSEEKVPHDMVFGEIGIAEVLLMPNSQLINRAVKDSGFREKYNINILGIQRGGKYLLQDLKDEKMHSGDALLVQGTWKDIARLNEVQSEWVVVGQPLAEAAKVTLDHKAPIAATIMILMIIAMVFDFIPVAPVAAVIVAALLMVLTGCLRNVEDAYKTINWESIVLIAAMLPMSLALEKTGATLLLTMFISNTATAVLLAPIALKAALDIGVSPYPFLFAVTVAASMCFASPFSTPPNALVMSAGKYTFMDYVKVGLPLQVIMGIVMVLVLPLLFPF